MGGDVGADLAAIPLCHSRDDTGCVISYASFRATAPPRQQPLRPLATAGLAGGLYQPGRVGERHHPPAPCISRRAAARCRSARPPPSPPWIDPGLGVSITTPFVTLPRFLDADCRSDGGFKAVTVHGDAGDPRIDDIGGEFRRPTGAAPGRRQRRHGRPGHHRRPPGPRLAELPLPGDCDADGRVEVDELLLGVNVLLAREPLDRCDVADGGRDGAVTVDDLIASPGQCPRRLRASVGAAFPQRSGFALNCHARKSIESHDRRTHSAVGGLFQDQVVLVTGASSGIGCETALMFGQRGARVALVARRRRALEDVAAAIRARAAARWWHRPTSATRPRRAPRSARCAAPGAASTCW
ncbi:MAG: SDR family NAD(P)-dependent oxidoreductase [Candidatus Binatia bacterium]